MIFSFLEDDQVGGGGEGFGGRHHRITSLVSLDKAVAMVVVSTAVVFSSPSLPLFLSYLSASSRSIFP